MNTMNRCVKVFTLVLALVAGAVSAQTMRRDPPKDVKPARLVVTAPPEITLNGKPDRLSPGSRIRNTQNLIILSGNLVGQELPVVYRRDAAGLVHEAWILTPAEYAKVGGIDADSAEGYQRFAELMALIFGARK
jgi:hypothetical protein